MNIADFVFVNSFDCVEKFDLLAWVVFVAVVKTDRWKNPLLTVYAESSFRRSICGYLLSM